MGIFLGYVAAFILGWSACCLCGSVLLARRRAEQARDLVRRVDAMIEAALAAAHESDNGGRGW